MEFFLLNNGSYSSFFMVFFGAVKLYLKPSSFHFLSHAHLKLENGKLFLASFHKWPLFITSCGDSYGWYLVICGYHSIIFYPRCLSLKYMLKKKYYYGRFLLVLSCNKHSGWKIPNFTFSAYNFYKYWFDVELSDKLIFLALIIPLANGICIPVI